MGSRKHVLLVLPALLAAMGSTQSAAYAGEEITLAADFAAAPQQVRIATPADFAAMDAQPPQLAASNDDASPPPAAEPAADAGSLSADDAALRRTVLEIVAEARSRIGLLPAAAASPEVVSAAIASPEPPAATEAHRRTIFDILAEARGNPRFLVKGASLVDDPESDASVESVAEPALPPEDEVLADKSHPSVAPHATHHAIKEAIATAPDRSRVLAHEASPAASVANLSPGQFGAEAIPPSEADVHIGGAPQPIEPEAPKQTVLEVVTEARSQIGFLPEPAATPAQSGGEADSAKPAVAEAHRRTIFDTLAEARGNPRPVEKNAAPANDLGSERSATAPMVTVESPAAGTSALDLPRPSAAEAHRQTILEAVAEARSRVGFLPQPVASPDLISHPPMGVLAVTQEAPRRTIFDVLAEARSDSRPPAKQASGAGIPHDSAVARPAAPLREPLAKLDEAPSPVVVPSERSSQAPSAESAVSQPPAAGKRHLIAAAEIDAEKLDTLRGGFEAPGGLRVSFGIERAVIVNGVLQSSTELRVNDLGRAAGGTANPGNALPASGMATVVQNGVNNTTLANLPASALSTVVQNSLDNQHLQTITRINAIVNSAEMLRTTRMQQSLQDSLNRAALAR